MATEGSVYQRKDGRWCAQYRDAKGKVRHLYRKSEAKQALKDRDQGIVPPSKMTVDALLDEWLDELKVNVSRRTWFNRESLVRVDVRTTPGDTRLSKLDAKSVRGLYRAKLADGLSSGTVKRIHVIINQAMRHTVSSK